jgi:Na+/H+ antiporter NhaD/arsenite permease-like protein
MAPFSLILLLILLVFASFIKSENHMNNISRQKVAMNKLSFIYMILLFAVLLIIFRIIPVYTGILIIIIPLLLDRKAFKIDYFLLLSFFFFIGCTENIKIMLASRLNCSQHVFLLSALTSQIMSNVPTAFLFAKLTDNWRALLWGTNVGGFGSLFGSFANLIAYKIYSTNEKNNNSFLFIIKFSIIGYTAFILSIFLYFIL